MWHLGFFPEGVCNIIRYHKRPQRSEHQERTCSRTGRITKGNYAKKNTIAKSATIRVGQAL